MQCYVYRGSRKEGAYLYLSQKDNFENVPEALQNSLGTLIFALEFDLHPERKLAQADAKTVLENLQEQGFHLQLAPPIESLMQESTNHKLPQER